LILVLVQELKQFNLHKEDLILLLQIFPKLSLKKKVPDENKYPNLEFIVDNILYSNFEDNYFDYIFDRGCFHVFTNEDRSKYYNEVKRILKEKGILFLNVLVQVNQL
jgi:ubiquinone/menaquinone biosynthesis C-methylase UbiE